MLSYYEYERKLTSVLQVLIPLLGCMVFLLILLNAYTIGRQNIQQRPSLRIYINLIAVDFITVLGGMSLVIFYKYKIPLAAQIFQCTNLITFYSSLMLFFCLAIARILIMGGYYQHQGARMAMIMITISWIITVLILTIHLMVNIPDYERYPVLSGIQSALILLIGAATVLMNLYIVTFTLLNRINHTQQVSANITAILLFTSTFLCLSFPLTVNGYFLFNVCTGGSCPAEEDITDWFHFLMCTKNGRHETELMFLLVQSLGNSLVMLCQKNTRNVLINLRERIVSIWRTDPLNFYL